VDKEILHLQRMDHKGELIHLLHTLLKFMIGWFELIPVNPLKYLFIADGI